MQLLKKSKGERSNANLYVAVSYPVICVHVGRLLPFIDRGQLCPLGLCYTYRIKCSAVRGFVP